MKKSKFFEIHELVCPDVYNRDGEKAFRYFRPVLIDFIDWLREELNVPVYINNWNWGGDLDERGYRCNLCSLVSQKRYLYVSGHMLGAGVDLNIEGMHPDNVKSWIEKNIHRFFKLHKKYRAKCRMETVELAPTWTHIDFYDHDEKEIVKWIG